MTTMVTVIALWLGAAAAILTPVVYATGNQWWTTYWGRTLLLKDAVIALAYGRSVGTLLGHRLPRSVPWDTWAISAAMAVALLANLAVMVYVTRRGQRRRIVPAVAPLEVVFTARPGSGSECVFVEVERAGRSVRAGEWVDRPDGTVALRLTSTDLPR